jgi:hypothetical protein
VSGGKGVGASLPLRLAWSLLVCFNRFQASAELYLQISEKTGGGHRKLWLCYGRSFALTWQDEEAENHVSYSAVRAGYENAVLFLLCDIVKQMLEHVDWTLLRLRAEYTAMTHSVADGLQASKIYHLEQRYRNISSLWLARESKYRWLSLHAFLMSVFSHIHGEHQCPICDHGRNAVHIQCITCSFSYSHHHLDPVMSLRTPGRSAFGAFIVLCLMYVAILRNVFTPYNESHLWLVKYMSQFPLEYKFHMNCWPLMWKAVVSSADLF